SWSRPGRRDPSPRGAAPPIGPGRGPAALYRGVRRVPRRAALPPQPARSLPKQRQSRRARTPAGHYPVGGERGCRGMTRKSRIDQQQKNKKLLSTTFAVSATSASFRDFRVRSQLCSGLRGAELQVELAEILGAEPLEVLLQLLGAQLRRVLQLLRVER